MYISIEHGTSAFFVMFVMQKALDLDAAAGTFLTVIIDRRVLPGIPIASRIGVIVRTMNGIIRDTGVDSVQESR